MTRIFTHIPRVPGGKFSNVRDHIQSEIETLMDDIDGMQIRVASHYDLSELNRFLFPDPRNDDSVMGIQNDVEANVFASLRNRLRSIDRRRPQFRTREYGYYHNYTWAELH